MPPVPHELTLPPAALAFTAPVGHAHQPDPPHSLPQLIPVGPGVVLHGTFMARLGGLPKDVLARLTCRELAAAGDERATARTAYDAAQESISGLLYRAVPEQPHASQRNVLLGLRRRLHSGRVEAMPQGALSSSVLASCSLSPADASSITGHVNALGAIHGQEQELRALHDAAVLTTRRALASLIRDEDFATGILLSSSSLFGRINWYASQSPSQTGSRYERVERGLLRYLTRASGKATPFGRFYSAVMARFELDVGRACTAQPFLIGSLSRRSSQALPNKRLLPLIWALATEESDTAIHLPLRWNSTARRDGARLRFLFASGASESFRSIKYTPVVALVETLFTRSGEWTLASLATALATELPSEIDGPQLRAYLRRIVDVGLLIFSHGVEEHAGEWPATLASVFAAIPTSLSAELVDLLRGVSPQRQDWSDGSVTTRAAALGRIAAAVSRLQIGDPAARLKTTPLLFEDTSCPAELRLRMTASLRDVMSTFAAYVRLTHCLAYPRAQQARLRAFFDRRYSDGAAIPLLDFFEDAQRELHATPAPTEVSAAPADTSADAEMPTIPEPPHVGALSAAMARLHALFGSAWGRCAGAGIADIPLAQLEEAIGDVARRRDEALSIAAFCQVVQDGATASPLLIVGGGRYATGHGRYFSRFLGTLPHGLTRNLLATNVRTSPHLVAEIALDQCFNGNLHAPLTAAVIEYPGTAAPAGPQSISCLDLVVSQDAHDAHELALHQLSSGRRVQPVELGFLSPHLRPPLYRLLSALAAPSSFSLPLPHSIPRSADSIPTASEQVTVRPRFTIAGCIVVARKQWRCGKSALPRRASREPWSAYFVRVDDWRRQSQIPDSVYVHVAMTTRGAPPGHRGDRTSIASEEEESGARALFTDAPRANSEADGDIDSRREGQQSDDRKPQFIDFRSPLLVRLLARIAEQAAGTVVFEEVLPDDEQLPRVDDQRFVYEALIQLELASASRQPV